MNLKFNRGLWALLSGQLSRPAVEAGAQSSSPRSSAVLPPVCSGGGRVTGPFPASCTGVVVSLSPRKREIDHRVPGGGVVPGPRCPGCALPVWEGDPHGFVGVPSSLEEAATSWDRFVEATLQGVSWAVFAVSLHPKVTPLGPKALAPRLVHARMDLLFMHVARVNRFGSETRSKMVGSLQTATVCCSRVLDSVLVDILRARGK